MATTGANFVKIKNSNGIFTGAGTVAAGTDIVKALGPTSVLDACNGGPGACIDRVVFDLSLLAAPSLGASEKSYGTHVSGGAKNGAVNLVLTGTTAIDVDLTDLTISGTQQAAGDTTFATVNAIVLNNLGTTDLTIKPGASNTANFPKFTGTTPTLTIPAGSAICLQNAAGATVDSTHKIFTITPTSGGILGISVAGA